MVKARIEVQEKSGFKNYKTVTIKNASVEDLEELISSCSPYPVEITENLYIYGNKISTSMILACWEEC
jgi:hypothetical protein